MQIPKDILKSTTSLFHSRLALRIAMPALLVVAIFLVPAFLGYRYERVVDETGERVAASEDSLSHLAAMESALRSEQIAAYEFMFERDPGALDMFMRASEQVDTLHDQAAAHADSAVEVEDLRECQVLHEEINSIFFSEIVPAMRGGADPMSLLAVEDELDVRFQRLMRLTYDVRASFEEDRMAADLDRIESREAATEWIWASTFIGIGLALLVAGVSARRLIGPMKSLAGAARRMSDGDLTSRVKVGGNDELTEMGDAFNFMAKSLQSRTTQLETQLARNRAIHQSIGDGIIVVDRGGTIVSINPAAEVALDRPAIELEGSRDTGVPELQHILTTGIEPEDMVKCWEAKNCLKVECPSHGSRDRRCWLQCATHCYNEIQGTFRQKRDACERCDVFRANAVREMNLKINARHYNLEVVPILDDFGKEEGKTVVLHDVTEMQKVKESLERHSAELEVLNKVSEAVASSLDLNVTLKTALGKAAVMMGAEAGFIRLLDADRENLALAAVHGLSTEDRARLAGSPGSRCCPDESSESCDAEVISDLRKDSCSQGKELPEGFLSSITAPLRSKGKVIGSITLLAKKPAAFSDSDARVMTLAGNQIGAAVENAILYGESVQHAREELAKSRIAAALTSSLDFKDAFESFTRETAKLVDFDRLSVTLQRDGLLHAFAVAGKGGIDMPSEGHTSPLAGFSPGWVVENRQPYFSGDIERVSRFRDQKMLLKAGFRSQMNLPLIVKEEVLGTLNFGSYRSGAYARTEVDKLMPVAHQVAMALANQRLFEDVARAKTEWEATFDSVSEGIVIVDNKHTVLRMNQAAADMVGGKIPDLLGQRCHEVIHKLCDEPAGCPMSSAVIGQGTARAEQEFPDGRTLELVVDPMFDHNGHKLGAVHFLRDVTEAKRLRQQLVQSEKMVAVGQLVSGVAHEINNPLTGVIGYSQLLLGRDLDDRVRRDLEQICREAERATKIVRHLLSFARKHQPERRLIDINQVVRESLELKAYDLRVNNIELSADLDGALPMTTADPHQLQQVFLNLITNAEQAMLEQRGGGLIKVRTGSRNGSIVVSVADNGPGIPEEQRDRVFDPFFTTKDVGKGTGLGLSVCYGVIEEHGGSIHVEPDYREGAMLVVELPLAAEPVSGDEPPQSAPREFRPVKPALAGGLVGDILLIDDEAAIREMLTETLKSIGHSVDTAKDGRVALRMLGKKHYDCIVSDVKMPGLDGPTLHRRVRETDPELAGAFVFISGDTVSPETQSYLDEVDNPYLAKPFRLEDLSAVLQKVIGSRDKKSG